MLALKIEDIRDFMSQMLKKDTFDAFEARDVKITTFTDFDISCDINKDFYPDPKEAPAHCLWSDIKPFVFEIVKGKSLPRFMKIVFAADTSLMESLSPNASVFYINISFENSALTLTTGCGMKTFTLDKSAELKWDEYIKEFLNTKKVSVSTLI